MKFNELQQKVQERINKVINLRFIPFFARFNTKNNNVLEFLDARVTIEACSEVYLFNYYLSLAQQFDSNETGQTDLIKTINTQLESLRTLSANLSFSAEAHLEKAIEKEDMELLEASLAGGADVNKKYIFRYPLEIASEKRDLKILRRLLETSPTNVNAGNPLVLLCSSRSEEALELIDKLLLLGADVNRPTSGEYGGETPLLAAVLAENRPLIDRLLQVPDLMINAPTRYGRYHSALDAAIEQNLYDVVEKFLKKDPIFNERLFTDACKRGFVDIAQLLHHTKNQDAHDIDMSLIESCSAGQLASAKYLISLGANCNAAIKYDNTYTPLTQAICNGHTQLAQFLISNNADKNHTMQALKMNNLIFAAAIGDLDTVKVLLASGSYDINAVDNEGRTALVRASHGGNHGIVELLVKAGADPNIQSKKCHRTALIEASKKGHVEVVQALLRAPNIDISVEDSGACADAESIARRNNCLNIVKLIQTFKETQELIPLIRGQILDLCHYLMDLQLGKWIYNAEYTLLSKLDSKIKATDFASLDELKNAAKNVIMLSLQRVCFGLSNTTDTGLLIVKLINQREFESLKKLLFPAQQNQVSYNDLVSLIMGPQYDLRFFSSGHKEKMFQLYLHKTDNELVSEEERRVFFTKF